jgi:conjugal transfer pilin signal peptidase TrbI
MAGLALAALPRAAAVSLGSGGPGQPARPLRLPLACMIVLPVGLATWSAIPQITWVISPSINAWAVRASPGAIRRGDLVSFVLTHPIAGPRPVHVTKHALCLPGDRLEVIERQSVYPGIKDGWYYCNGRLLSVSKPRTRNGESLAHFIPAHRRVPAGYAFVGSAHPDGFDSRYFGLIALSRLVRMERAL